MHPVTLPSLRCYSWGHLSRFWNVLGILFPESCFPSRVPEHSSLVNSSGDLVNPGPSCLLGDFQVVAPAVRDLFKLLSRACLPGAGFQSADCPAVGLDWLLRSLSLYFWAQTIKLSLPHLRRTSVEEKHGLTRSNDPKLDRWLFNNS